MSMSQKDPPALRSQQSHAFMHTNSVAHKSGDEVRRQAEEFEQYGSELEVCLPSQEEKEFRRDLRFYTTLFGDLEPRDLLFEWNDRFELGITFVDKQHFKLVELINELHHVCILFSLFAGIALFAAAAVAAFFFLLCSGERIVLFMRQTERTSNATTVTAATKRVDFLI